MILATPFVGAILLALLMFAPWVSSTSQAAEVTVEIQGISGALLDNVRAGLGIELQKNAERLSEERVQRLHRRAPAEIREALQPLGYYEPQVKANLVPTANGWQASYHIDPGPAVKITVLEVRVLGADIQDAGLQALVQAFPLQEGDVLHHGHYEAGKRAFQSYMVEHGYLSGQIPIHEITVDLPSHTATVRLHIEPGPRYRFGAITIQTAEDAVAPEKALTPKLLRRLIPIRTGDPYSTTGLLELQSAFNDSDYFTLVDVKARRDLATDNSVPIEVRVSYPPRHRYTAGLGFGADSGLRGKLGWENRRVNRRGHRLKTEFKASQIKQSTAAEYFIPLRRARTDHIKLTASQIRETLDNSDSEITTLGTSRTHRIGGGWLQGWLQTEYIEYQRENFRTVNNRGDSALFLPGISWSRVSADDRIYTRRGTRWFADVRGTDPALGSDTRFVQVRLQGKAIFPVFKADRLITRGEAGLSQVGEFSKLPASLRFYTGGDLSVRGYRYNSLGPTDGGEQLLLGSVEYEHVWNASWSSAVFYDVGNAFSDWHTALSRGAGTGIRWRSPLGQVRLDLGWPLDNPEHPSVRFHLIIGPDL